MLHTKDQGSRPYGFRQEDFSIFFLMYAYVKHVTPGAEPFWPQEDNLNKLGRSLLGDATLPNIKALGLVVSEKKISKVFILKIYF